MSKPHSILGKLSLDDPAVQAFVRGETLGPAPGVTETPQETPAPVKEKKASEPVIEDDNDEETRTARFGMRMPLELHTRLRLASFCTRRLMADIVIEALEEYLDRNPPPL